MPKKIIIAFTQCSCNKREMKIMARTFLSGSASLWSPSEEKAKTKNCLTNVVLCQQCPELYKRARSFCVQQATGIVRSLPWSQSVALALPTPLYPTDASRYPVRECCTMHTPCRLEWSMFLSMVLGRVGLGTGEGGVIGSWASVQCAEDGVRLSSCNVR